ncbi:hypothetical protein L218DRAFT_1006260 [Marasmius fiardii PR-910]|nr:hypothetical protein L218DRAFT_1006260 [Marasmius fiardii PR-910]
MPTLKLFLEHSKNVPILFHLTLPSDENSPDLKSDLLHLLLTHQSHWCHFDISSENLCITEMLEQLCFTFTSWPVLESILVDNLIMGALITPTPFPKAQGIQTIMLRFKYPNALLDDLLDSLLPMKTFQNLTIKGAFYGNNTINCILTPAAPSPETFTY